MKLQIYEEDGKWDDTWNQRTQMQEYLCEGELWWIWLIVTGHLNFTINQ